MVKKGKACVEEKGDASSREFLCGFFTGSLCCVSIEGQLHIDASLFGLNESVDEIFLGECEHSDENRGVGGIDFFFEM